MQLLPGSPECHEEGDTDDDEDADDGAEDDGDGGGGDVGVGQALARVLAVIPEVGSDGLLVWLG